MARFYAEVLSGPGRATRTGGLSGIVAHVRGWHVGVRVRLWVDSDGRDRMEVYRTGGSSEPDDAGLLARFSEPEDA